MCSLHSIKYSLCGATPFWQTNILVVVGDVFKDQYCFCKDIIHVIGLRMSFGKLDKIFVEYDTLQREPPLQRSLCTQFFTLHIQKAIKC
jgi:hypothetical protein